MVIEIRNPRSSQLRRCGNAECKHMLRSKAELDAFERPQAPQCQASSDEKHTSKRSLGNDKSRTMAAKSAARRTAMLAQVVVHINTCGLNRWRKSKQNANQH